MSLEKLDDIGVLLRAHLAEEAGGGFLRLTRTPSTSVVKFLDYFDTLPETERDSLLTTLSQIGALGFLPPLAVRERLEGFVATDPAFVRYREAMLSQQFNMGLRHVGLRMLKACLGDRMSMEMMAETRAKLNFVPRDDLPGALVPDPDFAHLKPAKAPLFRKLINKSFGDLFAREKLKRPGGEMEYIGALQGTNIKATIDFGAMGYQLRYGVSIPDETKTTFVWRRTYEDLWASGTGWDMLTEENAEASIHLLCEHVMQIVSLRNRVMKLL